MEDAIEDIGRRYSCELDALEKALKSSVKKNCKGKNVGVPFSGGVDSTLLAVLAKEFSEKVILYSVGVGGSDDMACAGRVSGELALPLRKKILSEQEVVSVGEKVAGITKMRGLMDVELGIPLFLCCEMAKEDGIKLLISGQGAEELFAGYERHLGIFRERGNLAGALRKEIEALGKGDLKRNGIIARKEGMAVGYPFLDGDVIDAAFAFPVGLNLSERGDKKLVLRALAKRLGVPEGAWKRRKRAVQYGSGIHNVLLRIKKKSEK